MTTAAVAALLGRIEETLRRRALLKGGERVLVACSGGPDSLALLHALARIAPAHELTLHVAHFDHGLRRGSPADASFVAAQARRLGLPATVGAAGAGERPRGLSPEEAARESRLRFLERTADATGADRIATGHTMDDQAETVLMRLIAGAGRRGLSGIPPARDPYVRPLIDCRRAQTEAFCRALRLRPRRDPTNADTALRRNAIRAELLPMLEGSFNARIVEALARTADLSRDEDSWLEEATTRALEAAGIEPGEPVSTDALNALPAALARRAVRRLAPGLDAAAVERVRALARSGSTGDAVDVGGRLKARVEYGCLVIGPAGAATRKRAPHVLVVPGETDLPEWRLRMSAWFEEGPPATWPDGRAACVLDAARVALPLTVRARREGDRFRPHGMTRSKKLGDFFTDSKIARSARDDVPIVADANGSIVWVVGHRPDDRSKVTQRTRRVLWLAAS